MRGSCKVSWHHPRDFRMAMFMSILSVLSLYNQTILVFFDYHLDMNTSISELVYECHQRFDMALATLPSIPAEARLEMPMAKMATFRDRLIIWSGSLGARQYGRMSLDSRLSNSTIIRTNVVKLLQKLSSTLETCKFHLLLAC